MMAVYYNDNDPFCCKVLRKQITLGNLPKGRVDERDIRRLHATDFVGYAHVHLFAGIGGFPLGLGWASFPERFRTLTLGFPCQDISTAGRGAGIRGERSGLWSEAVRLMGEYRELGFTFDYILIENVRNLLSGGDEHTICPTGQGDVGDHAEESVFVTWMGIVLADLAACGYDAEWRVFSAAEVGAPHIRERVFIVAYPCGATTPLEEHRGGGQGGEQAFTPQPAFLRQENGKNGAAGDRTDRAYVANPDRSEWGQGQPGGYLTDRHESGWQEETGGFAGLRSQDGERGVANTPCIGWGTWGAVPEGQQRQTSFVKCGSPLANPTEQGLSQWGRPHITTDGEKTGRGMESQPQRRGDVANPCSTGREELGPLPIAREEGYATRGNTAAGIERYAQPRLGGVLDGISARMDEYRWPTGPGKTQHSWEPPRVIVGKLPHRVQRIKALGNSLIPQLAEAIALCVMAYEQERERGVA